MRERRKKLINNDRKTDRLIGRYKDDEKERGRRVERQKEKYI
jgi:hypothetical protein